MSPPDRPDRQPGGIAMFCFFDCFREQSLSIRYLPGLVYRTVTVSPILTFVVHSFEYIPATVLSINHIIEFFHFVMKGMKEKAPEYLRVVPFGLLFESLGIKVSQLNGFFRGKIGFLCGMEMVLHLFYNMFRFGIILNFQVCGCLAHLMGMPADRAELPALEPINIRKCPASRAPDDEVHGNLVMCFILIKIYRRLLKFQQGTWFFCAATPQRT
jgi:hypothetical protein